MKKLSYLLATLLLSMWSFLALPVTTVAAADTCTWTGLNSSNWSDGGNWSGCDNGGVPEDGDSLVFPSGSNTTSNNDIVGTLTLDQIDVTGDNYAITGNAIEISGYLQFTGNDNNFNMADMTFANASTGTSLQIDGTGNSIASSVGISLPAGDFNAYVNADFTAPTFTGSMTNFNKWGTATFNSASGSTFLTAGGINISEGVWACSSADCAGDSGNFIAQYSGGRLLFSGNIVFPNDIGLNYLNGASSVGIELDDSAGVSLTGAVSVNGPTQIQLGNGSNFQTIGSVNMISSLEVLGNTATTSNYLVSSAGLTNSSELSCSNVTCQLDVAMPTYEGVIRGKTGSVIQPSLSDALGSTVGNTVIESGSTLYTSDSFSISEPLTITGSGEGSGVNQGAIVADTNDITYSGDVALASNATIYAANGAEMTLVGAISGSADLNVSRNSASSFVTFDGTTANTYTGTTYVYGGLQLIKDPGVIAVPGNMVIDGTSGLAQVQINNANQIADTANINMIETVAFNAQLQTDAETVGSLSGAGAVYIVQNTFNVGADNSSTTYTGSITTNNIVPGTLNKQGTGTFNLDGTTSIGFEPNFTVSGGVMNVLANYSTSPFSTSANGIIKGSGQTGITTINTGGTLAAGTSPGCITTGVLTLSSGSIFEEEIAGGTACTEYDRTNVNGNANLGGATLSVLPSYTPTPGTVYTILQTTNGNVIGTFNGLADGATFTANGIQFRINYTNTQVNLTVLGGTLVPTGQNHNGIAFLALAVLILGLGGVYFALRRNKFTIQRTTL